MDEQKLRRSIEQTIDAITAELYRLGWQGPAHPDTYPGLASDYEVVGFGVRAVLQSKPWPADLMARTIGTYWQRLSQLAEYKEFEKIWIGQFGYSKLELDPAAIAGAVASAAAPPNLDPSGLMWIVCGGISAKVLGGNVASFVDEAVSKTKEAAANPRQQVSFEAPLQNFEAEGPNRIDLTDRVYLKRYSSYERAHLLGGVNSAAIFGVTTTDIQFTAWALVTYGEWSSAWADVEVAQGRLAEVLSALRLFHDAPVGLLGLSAFGEPWHHVLMGYKNLYYQTQLLAPDRPQLEYRLGTAEVERFKEFLSGYRTATARGQRGTLPIAIRRFNDTYFHTRWEDRYVDAVIAMEALFLSGERENQSFRFAACGSVLLGDTPEEREQLFRQLRRAYSQRSKLLHGSMLTVELDDLRQVETLARHAIQRVLGLPDNLKDGRLVTVLERRLVRGKFGDLSGSYEGHHTG